MRIEKIIKCTVTVIQIRLGRAGEGAGYLGYQESLARPTGSGVIHIPQDSGEMRKWAQGDQDAFGHWLGLLQAGKLQGRAKE